MHKTFKTTNTQTKSPTTEILIELSEVRSRHYLFIYLFFILQII